MKLRSVWFGLLAAPLLAMLLPLPALADISPGITASDAVPRAMRAPSLSAVAGCPDRGGLLDSISVPVEKPLDLRVQIGVPAPAGGATFQLRSDDPSIVAAGDRRQGFLPRVFIPEGAFVSNTFTVFGIKVGRTQLRLIALTPGFGNGAFPLGAWDLNKGGAERFLDANAASKTCRASDGSSDLSTDPNRLSQCGAPAKGLASDGGSRLLLRGMSGLPGTLCYEITSSSAAGQGEISAPLVTTQTVGSLHYGFSFLKAPESYEDTADFRRLEVEVTFTPGIGNGNTTRFRAETQIVRPPVVLVHGVWSSSGAWDGDYIKNDSFHSTEAADYSGTNGARFTTNAPRIQEFVNRALKATRDKGYAATKADVMGHSMGGILTRMHITGSNFKRPDNFGQGDVRRLITLNTPHSGSTFPNLVTSLHSLRPAATVAAVRSITGFAPQGGAVCDLAENSPGLMALNAATTIKAQAITGTGGPAATAAAPGRFFGGLIGFGNIEGELTKTRCTRRNAFFVCVEETPLFPQNVVDAFRFRQANDTIVSRISQQGGHCAVAGLAGVNFANVIHSGPGIVNGVLSTGSVATRAYELLDGPDSSFVGSFPGVAATGLGVACTVPGRGAVQDAQDYAGQCGAGGGLNLVANGSMTNLKPKLAVPADNRVQIVAPAAGQVFAPGSLVPITVRLTAPLVANDIGVLIPGFDSLPGSGYDGSTYQASFKIPPSFAGPLRLIPVITDTGDTHIEGPELTVGVRAIETPTAVAFQQRNFRLTPQAIGPSEALTVLGTYPGGIVRNISAGAAGTTYSSTDPAVVSVDADGLRQVVGTGIAVVRAHNAGLSDQAVFVVEDPANPLPSADVTGQFTIAQTGLRLDRTTGFFVQTIFVTNRQGQPIPGPLYLVLSGLPTGVNLISQSGLTQNVRVGSPYLTLPLVTDGLNLLPGQSVTFNAQFLNPSRTNFSYIPSVWRVSVQP